MKPGPAWLTLAVMLALLPGLAIFVTLMLRPASSLTADGCRPSLLHAAGFDRQDVANRSWARAEPEDAGIYAYLEPGRTALKADVEQEILWILDGAGRGAQVEVFGFNISNRVDYVRQSFARDPLMPTDYRGVVRLSSPGCWEFDVKSGTVTGKVTFWVPK